MTISSAQFRPRAHVSVPAAQLGTGIQTGQSKQYHKLPEGVAPPLVGARGVMTTIDKMMSMGRPSDKPLPGGASAAGAPGSVLWASGA